MFRLFVKHHRIFIDRSFIGTQLIQQDDPFRCVMITFTNGKMHCDIGFGDIEIPFVLPVFFKKL